MILLDVNIWIPLLRDDHAQHDELTRWLAQTIADGELIGVSELALSGAVRIMTHPAILNPPSPPDVALDSCARALAAPGTRVVRPGNRHWQLFDRLVRQGGARGNDVADAYHAALAIENGATLASYDRGLARFAELRLVDPSAS